MKANLFKSGINYSIKNPWQTLLSIIGIMLGVAVVISIDIANQSAYKAFELSMESVSGKATHQIISNPPGLADSLFRIIKTEQYIPKAAPVIEKFVGYKGDIPRTFTLIGIDPFHEAPFRDYTADFRAIGGFDIAAFLTKKGAVVMSEFTARSLNINPGENFLVESDGKPKELFLLATIKTDNEKQAKIIENLLICDISNAQDIAESQGFISRIDLILDDSFDFENLEAILPESARLQKSDTRSETGKQMTESFRINLTAMSLLALIVGMFLIYNTMTFSVVRRQKLIGLLRSIGVTRKEVFQLIIFEALAVGFIGTALGIAAGIFLGTGIINLVTKTINDMYFVLQVQEISITPFSIFKGFALGISATLISAYKPASDATKVAPRTVLIRSQSESDIVVKFKKYLIYAVIFGFAGFLILLLDSKNIYFSYLGIAPIILAFALVTPAFLVVSMKLLSPFMKRLFGSIGKMAARGISTQLSRTTIAVAALSISVSAAIGVGTMVSSFRHTVVEWLNMRLKADIYASVPTMVSRFNDGAFDYEIADRVSQIDGVKGMNLYREYQINHEGNIKHILAARVQNFNYETFKDNEVPNNILWDKFNTKEGVFVSESYSFKNSTKIGDSIDLPTNFGLKRLAVIGIFIDYSSDIGLIMMELSTYRRYYNDSLLSGLAVFVKDKSQIDRIMDEIRIAAGEDLNFIVRSNRLLIDSSVEIFDRTFLITNVLQLLAIVVAFIGILSALMALQLEKARELGVLRAIGMIPAQLWKMVILQTGLMGLIAGILALPLGNILAYILIHIINRRSFGWSIDFYFIPEYAFQGVLVAIFAAVLAGIYPAYKMSKSSPAIALREE
ncbi:MAG: FtsX-like permease family protein [Candidatus Kapabacteria bacterium]|nr:FtsX-like permease family protein [Ignavibacteriota bacterium]MCW5883912.1 FtsX-like permease family protein [Candidatus Kapabacteria bacterium]